MKIVHERRKCIGCSSCVVICPKYWEMSEDGKAHLLNSEFNSEKGVEILEIKEIECNQEAVDVCPVKCINIEKS